MCAEYEVMSHGNAQPDEGVVPTKDITSTHARKAACAGRLTSVIVTHCAIIAARDEHDCIKIAEPSSL